MNNLSSYSRLTDSRMRASDTDLPVQVTILLSGTDVTYRASFCIPRSGLLLSYH
jgi:hypothetical protein